MISDDYNAKLVTTRKPLQLPETTNAGSKAGTRFIHQLREGAPMSRILQFSFAMAVMALLGASALPAHGQAPRRLSLQEAIQMGLQKNLQVLLAGTQVQEAAATRQRAFASLLPRVRGESAAILQNRSLRAFGITAPGLPSVVGPFSTYDFRVYLDQPLLDLASRHHWKASGSVEQAARLSYEDARDMIVRLVSGLYLNGQAAAARVDAARSRATTAEALLKLAIAQKEEGVATGVDVLRAEVSLANDRQRLLEAENETRRILLALAHAIGLDLGAPLELAEPLGFEQQEAPSVGSALADALTKRSDYLALQSQRQAVLQERQAARARYLPRLSLQANIGGIGRTLSQTDATGSIQGVLSVSLFDRDREGQIAEIDSRLRRLDHQLADLRLTVEQEIREALLNLESAAAEVKVAKQGRILADRELELARTRFETGVTSNIEVVNAQNSVARAQENDILALTRHADARAALARALGGYAKSLGSGRGLL